MEGDFVAARHEWDWVELGRRCRAEAMGVLGDPHTADEAAQEAMARAWRQRHRCRTPGAPGPWVARIARNEALRMRAGEQKQSELALLAAYERPRAESGAEDALVAQMSVREALAGLTLEERQLIDLRYKEDLAQPAIAAALGMPEGTVKVRLHRLRQRLRKVISEET